MKKKTKRILYLIAFILTFLVELFIALFVHDMFVRPYIGDVLVVVVIYFFVRIFVTEACSLLPVFIFIFAAGVEILQYFHFVERIGLYDNVFFRTLLGTSFDWIDILCYGVGSTFLMIWELYYRKIRHRIKT